MHIARRAAYTSGRKVMLTFRFDPYMGVGCVPLAALDYGLPCIACEVEEKYCAVAARRLEQGVLDFGPA